ncbi:MAG: hypothetical protein ACOY4C_04435 [Pseudomonadota bacterium]
MRLVLGFFPLLVALSPTHGLAQETAPASGATQRCSLADIEGYWSDESGELLNISDIEGDDGGTALRWRAGEHGDPGRPVMVALVRVRDNCIAVGRCGAQAASVCSVRAEPVARKLTVTVGGDSGYRREYSRAGVEVTGTAE